MINSGWRVCVLPPRLSAAAHSSVLGPLPKDWEGWLAADGTPVGTPFLLDPGFVYDVALNEFFRSAEIRELKPNNARAIARGLRQLKNYKAQIEAETGQTWDTQLDTYESFAPEC